MPIKYRRELGFQPGFYEGDKVYVLTAKTSGETMTVVEGNENGIYFENKNGRLIFVSYAAGLVMGEVTD